MPGATATPTSSGSRWTASSGSSRQRGRDRFDPGGDVPQRPAVSLTATVLAAPPPPPLPASSRHLLGGPPGRDEPDGVPLRPPGGGAGLSFQAEPVHVRPTWPARPRGQRTQTHSDL